MNKLEQAKEMAYKFNTIVGSDVVKSHGGRVATIAFLKGRSTSRIIKDIVKKYGKKKN